jgi:hypothetical protein
MVKRASYLFWNSQQTSYLYECVEASLQKPIEACILYDSTHALTSRCFALNEDVRFYKGKHKVRVLTRSQGNWIVEALEPFEDIVRGERVKVKSKERRIVAPNLLFRRESLPRPMKEHAYELKMEKKLKQIVKEKESKQ